SLAAPMRTFHLQRRSLCWNNWKKLVNSSAMFHQHSVRVFFHVCLSLSHKCTHTHTHTHILHTHTHILHTHTHTPHTRAHTHIPPTQARAHSHTLTQTRALSLSISNA